MIADVAETDLKSVRYPDSPRLRAFVDEVDLPGKQFRQFEEMPLFFLVEAGP